MPEVRADELKKGDRLLLKGHPYVVLKAKLRGKLVHLVVDGRGGTFSSDVKAKTRYDRIDSPKESVKRVGSGTERQEPAAQKPGPLHSPDGAQTRWADPGEWHPSTAWDEPASKVESKLIDRLGARLVAVETEGGQLVVPPVTDATVLGHLATMHRVTFEGATFADAKAWAKANPATEKPYPDVLTGITLAKAYATHDELHRDLVNMPRPHFHREQAPK